MSSSRFDKRKKTITRTFRIRQEWDNVIQEEATKQGVSVNVLLNKILRKFSLYTRWSDRNKDVTMSQRPLREILTYIETESVAKAAAKSGALDCVNLVNAMGLPMNYDSFVYLITEHFGGPNFARWFQCFHHQQGNKDIFHLQHDFGQKWSIYLENYLLAFLKAMTDAEATTRTYEYAVTLKVTKPRTKLFAKTTD